MKFRKMEFVNTKGETLSGRIDLPLKAKPLAYVLFAHCFTCTKDLSALHNISKALTQNGMAVFRFDFTGLGESGGDFSETNFSSNVSDLVAAAEFMKNRFDAPRILIGHSLGGAAVIRAASKIPSAKAVAVIGSPYDPAHVKHLFEGVKNEIEEKGEADVLLEGRPFKIKKQFIDDLPGKDPAEVLSKLRKALLVLHSPIDDVVGIENAGKIFMAAKHPKSFVSLDHADHLLSDKKDSLYAGAIIAAWAGKYVDRGEAEKEPAEGVVITLTGSDGYTTDIRAGRHSLTADEPEDAGGADMGPTPYDYLLSGLGACTGMTLRMYADYKKIPLDSVTVKLNHEKIHASDCDTCETKSGKLDVIERVIDLEGDLSDDVKRKMLEIADKCPVHRTLHSEIVVKTRLKE